MQFACDIFERVHMRLSDTKKLQKFSFRKTVLSNQSLGKHCRTERHWSLQIDSDG